MKAAEWESGEKKEDNWTIAPHFDVSYLFLKLQTKNRFLYGFLEFSSGYIADLDIESESMRFLGGLRFHVFGVHRLVFKRTRRGRLTYLPYDETQAKLAETTERDKFRYLPPLNEPIPTDDKRWKTIETDYFNLVIQNRSYLVNDTYVLPELRRLDPGYMLATLMYDQVSRFAVAKQMLSEEVYPVRHVELIRMIAYRFEPLGDTPSMMVVDGERVEYGPLQAEIMPNAGRVFGVLKDW